MSTAEHVPIKSTATTVPVYQDTTGQDVKQVSQGWIETIFLSFTLIYLFCEFSGCKIIFSQLQFSWRASIKHYRAQFCSCGKICSLHRCKRMPKQSMCQRRNMCGSNQRLQLYLLTRIQRDKMWNKWVRDESNNLFINHSDLFILWINGLCYETQWCFEFANSRVAKIIFFSLHFGERTSMMCIL